MSEFYQAGICNIGDQEIRHRKNTFGWGGLAVSLALFVILTFLGFSAPVYILMIPSVYVSVLGFIQTREKFCASFGLQGVHNMASNLGETQYVIGNINRLKDRKKSKLIQRNTILVTILICSLLAVLGHYL